MIEQFLDFYEKFLGKLVKFKIDLINIQSEKINMLTTEKDEFFGLSPIDKWNLSLDKILVEEDQTLQIANCTQIVNSDPENLKLVIHIKHTGKFLVSL